MQGQARGRDEAVGQWERALQAEAAEAALDHIDDAHVADLHR